MNFIQKFTINKIIPEKIETNNGKIYFLLKTNQTSEITIPDSLFKLANTTANIKSKISFLKLAYRANANIAVSITEYPISLKLC